MARLLNKYSRNDIISLTESAPAYDLAESVGPDLTLRELLDGGQLSELADLPLGYGSVQGRPDLREAIAELHNVHADEVVVTAGGMHGLFLIADILCEAGDEVVMTSPLFPNTLAALKATGAEVKTLPLSFDEKYRIDLEALKALLSERTRLVCLTSPQNPSGVMTPRETIWKLAQMMWTLCPDAYLLVDETYRHAVYGADVPAPSAVGLSSRIVACASLSKCHGAPGLRLGWAVTRDPALREQLFLAKFNSIISCSVVDEALALRVLKREEKILGDRRDHLAKGLDHVARWVKSHSGHVEWVRPDAGALCCIRLKAGAFDDAAVQRFYQALNREGVRVGCGSWFGEEPRVFRLGFGLLEMPELEKALTRLSSALQRTQMAAA